jgi:hypothetical protein
MRKIAGLEMESFCWGTAATDDCTVTVRQQFPLLAPPTEQEPRLRASIDDHRFTIGIKAFPQVKSMYKNIRLYWLVSSFDAVQATCLPDSVLRRDS